MQRTGPVRRNSGTQDLLHDTLAKHIGKRSKLRGRNRTYGGRRGIILKPARVIVIGSSGRNYSNNRCLCCFLDQRQNLALLTILKHFQKCLKREGTAKERCDEQKFTACRTQFLQALPYCQRNAARQFCTEGLRRLPCVSVQYELLVEREHTHQLFQEEGIALGPIQQHLGHALGKRAWEECAQMLGSGGRTQWSKWQ